MPTKVTIATFNCENLFVRYNFNSNLSEEKKQAAISNGFIVDNKIVSKILPIEKELTALNNSTTETLKYEVEVL